MLSFYNEGEYMNKQKTLILIDGHALAYRMFFALERTGMKTSTKMPTWAIFGFIRAIIDILKKIKPDAIAVSFDMGRKTFRTEEYQEYKAQRAAMPDALREQMQAIIDAVAAFNIPVYMMENFEADEEFYEITTTPEEFSAVRECLDGTGITYLEAEVKMIPQNYMHLDADSARKMGLIVEKMEELDDVQEIWHNWDEEE